MLLVLVSFTWLVGLLHGMDLPVVKEPQPLSLDDINMMLEQMSVIGLVPQSLSDAVMLLTTIMKEVEITEKRLQYLQRSLHADKLKLTFNFSQLLVYHGELFTKKIQNALDSISVTIRAREGNIIDLKRMISQHQWSIRVMGDGSVKLQNDIIEHIKLCFTKGKVLEFDARCLLGVGPEDSRVIPVPPLDLEWETNENWLLNLTKTKVEPLTDIVEEDSIEELYEFEEEAQGRKPLIVQYNPVTIMDALMDGFLRVQDLSCCEAPVLVLHVHHLACTNKPIPSLKDMHLLRRLVAYQFEVAQLLMCNSLIVDLGASTVVQPKKKLYQELYDYYGRLYDLEIIYLKA